MKTQSLFEADRLTLPDAIDLSVASLNTYGERYRHWAIAYSGGKDSTATLAFVLWSLGSGRVTPPESLTVLYADTRMELPPLQQAAVRILEQVRAMGHDAHVVLPAMDNRFYVYMLGRGVPPPKNRFRWCTPQLKIEPMHAALTELRQQGRRQAADVDRRPPGRVGSARPADRGLVLEGFGRMWSGLVPGRNAGEYRRYAGATFALAAMSRV
jgi:DNA sulfur modification protein DndC